MRPLQGTTDREEVVEKRKRSLSMSSSGTTISTLGEREKGWNERDKEGERDKWRQNS